MDPHRTPRWAAAFYGRSTPVVSLVGYWQGPLRNEIGKVHAKKGEGPAQGWRRAYRKGWRIVPAIVEVPA